MGHSNNWNTHPKNYGPGSRAWLWELSWDNKRIRADCRQCFCSNTKKIGFIKLNLTAGEEVGIEYEVDDDWFYISIDAFYFEQDG